MALARRSFRMCSSSSICSSFSNSVFNCSAFSIFRRRRFCNGCASNNATSQQASNRITTIIRVSNGPKMMRPAMAISGPTKNTNAQKANVSNNVQHQVCFNVWPQRRKKFLIVRYFPVPERLPDTARSQHVFADLVHNQNRHRPAQDNRAPSSRSARPEHTTAVSACPV